MGSVRQLALAIILVEAIIPRLWAQQFVSPPALLRFVAPNYPCGAKSGASDEKVTAIVIVNADGTVREVTFKETMGTPLSSAIVKAVRKWVFVPARRGVEVVPAKISISFSFESKSRELMVDLGHYAGE